MSAISSQTNLYQAHEQWMSRPDDERFTSLIELNDHFQYQRDHSRAGVVSSRSLRLEPVNSHGQGRALSVIGPNGAAVAPTHHAFNQLCQLAEAPAGYLRTLPAALACDNVNYGLQFKRDIEEVGVLLYKNGGAPMLRAATGPNYGRIWNAEITQALVNRFGDGVTGDWCVPGEFGKALDQVTKENTTLFGGDRDMFVFLADEKHRIEVPNRRTMMNGTALNGSMARGFFVWNSEVGSCTFGVATFLFDYACANRIIWNVSGFQEFKLRHTKAAPDRFVEQLQPALIAYANSSAQGITQGIAAARNARLGDKLDDFLATRFGKQLVAPMKAVHELEEQRPIETLWDVATAATAYARGIGYQDARVDIERKAGKVLELAAA